MNPYLQHMELEQLFFFHSPFSPENISENENAALLLQLILNELIKSGLNLNKGSPQPFFPFNWNSKITMTSKMMEHASLLGLAFPQFSKEAQQFANNLHLPCKELIHFLEPFIVACKENENVLLFLVKHQKFLNIKSILDKIFPEGQKKLKMAIRKRYKKRGFLVSKWKRSHSNFSDF